MSGVLRRSWGHPGRTACGSGAEAHSSTTLCQQIWKTLGFQGLGPTDSLILTLWAPETTREQTSALSHLLCGPFLESGSIQPLRLKGPPHLQLLTAT